MTRRATARRAAIRNLWLDPAEPGAPTSVKLTVRLPANLVRGAKHRAADANLALQDVLTQALALLLARTRAR